MPHSPSRLLMHTPADLPLMAATMTGRTVAGIATAGLVQAPPTRRAAPEAVARSTIRTVPLLARQALHLYGEVNRAMEATLIGITMGLDVND